MKKKMIKNCIKCNYCGDIIFSENRHDFKECSCSIVAVDGGIDYLRRCFKNSPDDYTDLSEYEEDCYVIVITHSPEIAKLCDAEMKL